MVLTLSTSNLSTSLANKGRQITVKKYVELSQSCVMKIDHTDSEVKIFFQGTFPNWKKVYIAFQINGKKSSHEVLWWMLKRTDTNRYFIIELFRTKKYITESLIEYKRSKLSFSVQDDIRLKINWNWDLSISAIPKYVLSPTYLQLFRRWWTKVFCQNLSFCFRNSRMSFRWVWGKINPKKDEHNAYHAWNGCQL